MEDKRSLRSIFIGTLVLALVAMPAWPQASSGSVRGTVHDPTGAVIPSVAVTLTNTATGVEIKTVSNEVGIYVFPSVSPGPYKLQAESAGMKKFEGSVVVQTQQSATIDLTLSPAGTETIVSVQDVTPMLTSDTSTLSHTLERQRIEQLPINGRFVGNLLATVPGFTSGGDGWRFDGNRTGTFDVVLDGAALTEQLYGAGTVSRPPSLDSIQEFSVIVNSSSAKYSRPNTIIMTTKGGTNAIHGSLFETNRDNFYGVARARDNFTGVVSKLVRNEFGGTVGGPVWVPKLYNGKNKTFWFFNYEGLKQRSGTQNNYRVPNMTTRAGDFSDLVDTAGKMTVLYDPLTSGPGPNYLRQPFNYGGKVNNIDPSRLSPFMKYVYSVLPQPNIAGVNGYLGNNFYGNAPTIQNEYTWGARFDHRFSDKDLVYGRITKAMRSTLRPAAGGVPTLDGFGNSRTDTQPNESMSLDWTHTFSATWFNEFMFSASRSVETGFPGDFTRYYADELGLPNPNHQPGYPRVNTVGVGTGSGNYFASYNWNMQYFNYFIMEDNGTKIKGKHEIQYGMHLRFDQLTYMPQQQNVAGAVTAFPAVTTGLYDTVNSTVSSRTRQNYTGHEAAAAYLGYANYEVRLTKGKYYMRQKEDSFYIQDNWRATRRLTLNLGLRWQFSPYPNDKYYIMSSYSKKDNAIVLGNSLDTFYKVRATTQPFINILQGYGMKFMTWDQAGLPRTLVKNNWHDIGPHLGFAYRAFDGRKSFVIRGGYALNYMLIPIYGWNDRMRMNTPFFAAYQNYQLTDGAQSPAGDGINNWGLINAPTVVAGKNSANAVNFDKPMGITPGTSSFNNAYFNPDQPTSRVHDWNLTLEKEVMRDTVLRASYVGNKATKQDSYDDWNQQMPDYVWMATTKTLPPTGNAYNYANRPLSAGPYGNLQEWRKDGWAWSNGIRAELQRRYSRGYGYQIMYQFYNANKAASHGWYYDSYVSPVSSFLPAEQIPDRNRYMKTYLYKRDTNIPHDEIRWNWIVDIPVGKGKKLLGNANKFLDAFVGGWQLSSMGRWRNAWIGLPTGSRWPTGNKVEYYGRKYPIQDCTSGVCRNSYLMWNGYIPAYLINSVDATGKPNGYMGIPSDYKPAVAPLWPYPADYRSRNANNDPNFNNYGNSYIWLPVSNQTAPVRVNLSGTDSGGGIASPVHPFNGMSILGAGNWNFDTALFKSFRITEQARLRVQCDTFNTLNHPGDVMSAGASGVASNYGSQNGARVLQLSMRMTW